MRVHPSPTTRVLSDVCFPVSQPPLSGPDPPWLPFTLTCLLLKLPFLAQLFLLFCLKLLDPLPGSPSCRDSGLGRSLHTLRAGTQEADGFPLLPIHPGNGRGPAWEQEAGTGPGVGGRVSLKISERRKTPDQFHQAVEHIPHTLITFLGKHGGQ